MRLIDADKFISFIDKGKYCNPNALTFSENDLCEMIENQPTAYDVEKVVEELKRYRTYIECDEGLYVDVIDYDIVIDIVKRGGVDDY